MVPMRLGVDSKESGRSRTKSLARRRAMLANSESSEPVPCGKRCRRCSTLKEKRVSKRRTQSAGVKVATSYFRVECGILRSPLHAQPELCAEVARCEVGACPE